MVQLPVTLWEVITNVRPFTFSVQRRRLIKIVAITKDPIARKKIMQQLGLHENLRYDGPLYNSHINTILGGARLSRRVEYQRELLDGLDGNPICVDWLQCHRDSSSPSQKGAVEFPQGLVLVIPGAANTSQTPYIQRFARLSISRGYNCCILTPRGLGSAPVKVPQLTCTTFTDDLRVLLRERFSKKRIFEDYGRELPLFVVGYSAGGNTAIKGIAEEQAVLDQYYPSGFPVTCCICMNSPYDMIVSADGINSKAGVLFYQKGMLNTFKRTLRKHRKLIDQGLKGMSIEESNVDNLIKQMSTIDNMVLHYILPHFRYNNMEDYYKDGHVPTWIRHIKSFPVVAVAARDDPVVLYGVTAQNWQDMADAQPNIVYVETSVGGHLGYVLHPVDEWHERPSFLINFPFHVIDHYTASSQGS
ncbi:unnamed protein product [Phytomonas sp. Hart1]|nr:unnamed protein product [Phytomonas sp. Hart1]|eukprot:CCW68812.1 unnamed protein product [Phytomonas sp. isolate Hart1]